MALIAIQSPKIKDLSDIICSKQNFSYEALNLFVTQLSDVDVQIRNLAANEIFASLKLMPGSQLVIIG